MYITIEEFEEHVHQYMLLAKRLDLHVVDSSSGVAWTIQHQKKPPLGFLAKLVAGFSGKRNPFPSSEGYCSTDSFRPACLGPR